MSFRIRIVHFKQSKQKITIKSLTETELVGVSEYIPHNIQIEYCMREQGYELNTNIAYQDYKSAILIDKNRINSSTRNYRHIH